MNPVVINFTSKEYQIMGMANVMAVEKSKGYGTILIYHLKKYLVKNKFACIGNTHKDNFKFYEKSGFRFIPRLIERFVYIDKEGREYRGDWSDYCMFVYDKNDQLEKLIKGTTKIVTRVPLW